ncbi:hypothetical protein [Streptomyces californicus]
MTVGLSHIACSEGLLRLPTDAMPHGVTAPSPRSRPKWPHVKTREDL